MRTRWIVAAGLTAVGLVWIGQGLGLLRGSSFMVNDLRWAIAGGALLLIGTVVAWSAVRGGRQA
jgi:ABC-type nickel/cobalt efflux system permease component RcnA